MTGLRIRNLTPHLGAEVTGLSPVAPLEPATLKQLRALFAQRGLLAFPELQSDVRFQTYLAEQLVTDQPIDPDSLHVDELHQVSNVEKYAAVPFGRLMFHSDTMWEVDGCKAISLYGKVVATGAIPTLFSSAEHAWNTLPEDLRAQIEGRYAIHVPDATDQRRSHVSDDVLVVDFGSKQRLRLPIAYRHPRTGRTLLYVSPQLTHHIEGLDYEESESLLEALFDHMYAQANVFTYEWQQGNLIIWDNLTLQHARPDLKADGPPRTLRKTLVPAYMVPPEGQVVQVNYSRVGG